MRCSTLAEAKLAFVVPNRCQLCGKAQTDDEEPATLQTWLFGDLMRLLMPESGRPAAPWLARFAAEMLRRHPEMRPLDAIRHAAHAHQSYGGLDAMLALRLHLLSTRFAQCQPPPNAEGVLS